MTREVPIRSSSRLVAFGLIALAIALLDQFTKYLVNANIPLHDSIPVIPGYLNLVHARNPGASFSILSGSGGTARWVFLVVVSVAALSVILWMAVTSNEYDWRLFTGYALFFGGALGNLADRLRFGEVVDFIDVHVGSYHWPAFNVADSALCVGTAAFFAYFLFRRKPS